MNDTYNIKLIFNNLDNSLYTDHQATVQFRVQAGDAKHAWLLATHLQRVFEADNAELSQPR